MTAPQLLAESEAQDDRLKETFRDIKGSFKVPIVAEAFQAWAAVPHFLEVVWRRLRPNVLADPFIASAHSLRDVTERAVAAWPMGDHVSHLRARNVGDTDVSRMRDVGKMFCSLDHKVAIVAHSIRLALEGEDIGSGASGVTAERAPEETDFRGLPVVLVDERDAPFRVRAIYDALKKALALPFVPSDYRAMAAYPDWLDVWYRESKGEFEHPRYGSLRDDLTAGALDRARQIPYRIRLSPDTLATYRIDDRDRRRLLDATRTICGVMPQLCINMAIALRGLATSPAA